MTNLQEGVILGDGSSSRVQLATLAPDGAGTIDEWSAQFWLNVNLESTLSTRTNQPNLVRVSLNIRPDVFTSRGTARTFYTHILARTLWP